jgi:hypothetical protein
MKNTLRILAAALVVASASVAQAQGGGGGGAGGGGQQMTPEQRVARTRDMLFKDITLSPAQSAKADTIIMTASTKQREIMQAAQGGDMAAAREQGQKLTADRNAALKALLTADADKTKFDANVAAMPQGGRRGGLR